MRAREAERARADNVARHDPLTGLPNRRAFEQQLRRSGDAGEDGRVLAALDLDRFKPVNDLHGHAAGDRVLHQAGRRLTETLGDTAFVARLGGDEFAVFFDADVAPDAGAGLIRRAISAVEEPFEVDGARIHIGCCAGLALWQGALDASTALLNADKALYTGKRQGSGKLTWYDRELDRKTTERNLIEADLRAAIHQGDIKPYFQPVIDIRNRRVKGMEVLARWTHPVHGTVPPATFVPIAEEAGLIADLDWAVIHAACDAARDWDAGLVLSVNISPHQFKDRGLAKRLAAMLAETGFDPKRLEIEITESAVIHDFRTARDTIRKIRALGASIALDDFGTGFSSLATLRDLEFDRIKIDRGFVTGISERPENQKIVSGIMALAQGLELQVTAEGIESETDLSFLEALECSHGQGFLFDAAVPAEDVPWLLESRWQMAATGPEAATGDVRPTGSDG